MLRRLRILFTHPYFSEGMRWEPLAETILKPHELRICSGDKILENLEGVDVLVPWWNHITEEVYKTPSLGLIHQFGVGIDNISVPSATSNGIWVARLPAGPTANAASTAEVAILLMLAVSRKFPLAMSLVREAKGWGRPSGIGLMGKTICVVGMGDVGTAVVRRLKGWGAKITIVRRRVEAKMEPDIREVVERVYGQDDYFEALGEADFVISCVKYDLENRHLFNARAFEAMKRGKTIFINVARGGLVDEGALADALESGQLYGAGLDVFEKEPLPIDSRLLKLPNVVATPHFGGLTDNYYNMGAAVFAENVNRYARGEMIQYGVNHPMNPRTPLSK